MRISEISLALGLLALPLCAQTPAPAPRAQRIAVQTRVAGSYLGVYCMDVDSEIAKSANLKEERGVLVTKVDPDSPASRAGLQEKDVIMEYNTQRVEGTAHFIRLVSETPAGRKVTLGVFRNGAMQTLTATLASRTPPNMSFMFEAPGVPMPPMPAIPSAPNMPELTMPDIPSGLMGWQSSSLGYMGEPVDGQLAEFFGVKEGVLVRSVVAKSSADKAGMKAGDVIIKADGNNVRSPREITSLLHRQRESHKLSLTVVRAHKELTLELIAKNNGSASGDTIL
jgi:serine protease Do